MFAFQNINEHAGEKKWNSFGQHLKQLSRSSRDNVLFYLQIYSFIFFITKAMKCFTLNDHLILVENVSTAHWANQ